MCYNSIKLRKNYLNCNHQALNKDFKSYQKGTLKSDNKVRDDSNEISKLEKLAEVLSEGICVFNNSIILFVNNACASILGYKSIEEIIGSNVMSFLQVDQLEKFKAANKSADILVPKKLKVLKNDNTFIGIEVLACTSYDENGSIIVVFKKSEEGLEQNDDEVPLSKEKENLKLQNEFFSNISHELKTPLNVILSSQQLLELYLNNNDDININKSKMLKYIKIMRQNCNRLIRLLCNIIDMTKIDSGFFKVYMDNFDVVGVVKDIVFSVEDYIKNKGINISFESNVEEKIIACDPEQLERVILNLLSNSIKFTLPGGKIVVSITDGKECVKITVKDTGIGIPRSKLKVIFDRFKQVDKERYRNYEGSGIGLSLVKSIVEMHGGSIKASSKEGSGSEFIIRLPVRLVNGNKVSKSFGILTYKEKNVEKIKVELSDVYFDK